MKTDDLHFVTVCCLRTVCYSTSNIDRCELITIQFYLFACCRDQLIDELAKARCIPNRPSEDAVRHKQSEERRDPSRKDRDRDRDVHRRVCAAVAAGFFCNASRRSANSDSIFHSSFAWSGGSRDAEEGSASSSSNLRILHVHPSSVLSSSSCSAYHAAVAAGRKTTPEFVVYQDLVFSGGKAYMRNVSWMDTDTLRKCQRRWTPVSHPCMLSNRPDPTVPSSATVVAVTESEDGDTDAAAASRGIKRDRMGQMLLASTSDDTGISSNTNRQADSSKADLVDSAKARYLARKQQK